MPAGWLAAFAVVVILLLGQRRLYATRIRVQLLDDLRTITGVTAVSIMIVMVLRVLVGEADVAGEGIREWLLAAVCLGCGRVGFAALQAAARRRGIGLRPTLIIGAGRIAQLTARRLLKEPELGLRPMGFLDKDPLPGAEVEGIPVLGASWDLAEVISRHHVQQVIIAFSTAPHEVLLRIMNECEQRGVAVAFVPRLYEKVPEAFSVDRIGSLPLLSIYAKDPRSWQFRMKYAVDRVVAVAALLVGLPLLLVVAAGVWRSVGRPILFRQVRVGRDGHHFVMFKFRSMKESPMPPVLTDVLKLAGDSAPGGVEGSDRRTRFGAFIRKTSLDEIPQLFNVLRGDMSLVGPRPERPDFVKMFLPRVHRYEDRHRVKSGISGWAQVHGLRGRTSLTDRIEWDNYYIENWSPWLDVKILLLTFAAVLRARNVE